ncbi:hypothetical protein [Marinobacterium iners]|nr:hypothetical protein [Marinobacterium iners]
MNRLLAIFSFLGFIAVLVAARLPFATCLLNHPASTSQNLGLVAGGMSCCQKYSQLMFIIRKGRPMAHFDADRETIDWYRKNGSRKTSPQDIQYPDEARFVLSPEELEAALRPFDSSEGSQDSEPDSEA